MVCNNYKSEAQSRITREIKKKQTENPSLVLAVIIEPEI